MGALQGIRVLDLSRVLAGPWCGQVLADLGAEVIKVERPGIGDDTRMWGPPWMMDQAGKQTGESGYYQCANRNKYSIAIDISKEQGQALIQELVKTADVVIENYKAGSLKKYGLDYASLNAINPKIVYCSITGFGQTGPRSAEPGYDFVIQGLSGLMSITGEEDGLPGAGPQKVGVAVADIQTGLYSTIAIQAALIARQHTGRGQYIDMSLYDVQLAVLANQGMNYLTTGRSPKRMGNRHPNIVPYQTFNAQDNAFILACGNDSQFKALCSAIGLSELATHPDYLHNQDRVKCRDALTGLLSAHFATQPAQHWVELIHAAKVPVGRVNSIDEAFAEPQTHSREMVVNVPHCLNPDFKMVASPIKLSDTPVEYRHAPPQLGQHTIQILKEIRSAAALEALQQQGVVGV